MTEFIVGGLVGALGMYLFEHPEVRATLVEKVRKLFVKKDAP